MSTGSALPPANLDSMSPEEQIIVRCEIDLTTRYRDYSMDATAAPGERRYAWGLCLGGQFPFLTRYILRCIADGPVGAVVRFARQDAGRVV